MAAPVTYRELRIVLTELADDDLTEGNGGVPALVAWGVPQLARALHYLLGVAADHRPHERLDGTWGCACGWTQDKPHAEHVADMVTAAFTDPLPKDPT